nr:MAG TPA: hypothetical protein [Caudoviricetes sp.]
MYLVNRITRYDTNQGNWQCPLSSSNKHVIKVCPHIVRPMQGLCLPRR